MGKLTRWIILAALMCGSSSALATSYRLDFGGQTSSGTFGGHFILDFSVTDSSADPDRGSYDGLVTALYVDIEGVVYDQLDGVAPFIGFVANNSELAGDYFGIGGGITNANSDDGFIAIQFQNLDGTVFNTDELPTDFNFTDFDPFNVLDTNSTGAIVRLPNDAGTEFVALAFAELHPVPLPAGVWLFMSAMGAAFGWRKRS